MENLDNQKNESYYYNRAVMLAKIIGNDDFAELSDSLQQKLLDCFSSSVYEAVGGASGVEEVPHMVNALMSKTPV